MKKKLLELIILYIYHWKILIIINHTKDNNLFKIHILTNNNNISNNINKSSIDHYV